MLSERENDQKVVRHFRVSCSAKEAMTRGFRDMTSPCGKIITEALLKSKNPKEFELIILENSDLRFIRVGPVDHNDQCTGFIQFNTNSKTVRGIFMSSNTELLDLFSGQLIMQDNSCPYLKNCLKYVVLIGDNSFVNKYVQLERELLWFDQRINSLQEKEVSLNKMIAEQMIIGKDIAHYNKLRECLISKRALVDAELNDYIKEKNVSNGKFDPMYENLSLQRKILDEQSQELENMKIVIYTQQCLFDNDQKEIDTRLQCNRFERNSLNTEEWVLNGKFRKLKVEMGL